MARSKYWRTAEAVAMLTVSLWAVCTAQNSCGPSIPPAGAGMVSSPEYSSPVGRISCQWTIQPAPGKELYVAFDDFDLGPKTRLEIYSGSTSFTPANLVTTYFNKGPTAAVDPTLPGAASGVSRPVVSFPGTITVRYVNQEVYYPARGFQLHYYSDVPPASRSNTGSLQYVCGETLPGGVGVVQSPGYPGLYPLNAKCTWTIKSCDKSSPLRISFVSLNLENSFDWVRLYTVPDPSLGQTTGTLISEFTGNTLPATLDVAASQVAVQFSSDNIRSANTGFALKFSTAVAQQTVPIDPLTVDGACSGMCPNVSDIKNYQYCSAHDDPHMNTFCGKPYELQEEGVFYMYKHATSPIWVQAAFQHCSPGSYPKCLCAVAVRLCNELFVVDRCLTSPNGPRPNRVYKAGSGSLMQIAQDGAGWQVTLPSGLQVKIGGYSPIGFVEIRDPAASASAAGGVCNCNVSPRCGTTIDQINLNNPEAYNTWRVPPEESLFTPWSSVGPLPCDNTQCAKSCGTFPTYTQLPPTVANGNVQPASQFSRSINFYFASLVNRQALADVADFTPPWTREATLQYCARLLTQHPTLQFCQSKLAGGLVLDRAMDNCVLDILYTNTTSFAHAALTNAKGQCMKQLDDIPVPMCPSDCTGHGSCVNSRCICSSGWIGADCSQDSSQPPFLSETDEMPSCSVDDIVLGVCLKQRVFGTPFFSASAGYPACFITSVATLLGAAPSTPTTRAVTATLLSVSSLSCRLPAGSAGQSVTYTIRVTNNGVRFSNAVTTTRVFPAACGSTVSGFGFVTSPNFPLPYNNNTRCVYSLSAVPGKALTLTVKSFDVENSFDFVRAYDDGRLVDTFTGVLASGLRKVYGSRLTLIFSSDSSVTLSGFNISVTSWDTSAQCGGSRSGSGTIISPGSYPVFYPNNAYCIWSLAPAAGSQSLRLHFNLFDIEPGYDFLRLFVGGAQNSSYSGALVPADATYNQPIYLVFTSDSSISGKGFSLSFTSI